MSASSTVITSDSVQNSSPCPDDSTLAALCWGPLDDATRLELEAHAEACIACYLVVSALRSHASVAGPPPIDASLDAFVERVARHARVSLRAGARVGRYIVERPVGVGAMGMVYAAHDPELERKVALKVLRPDLAVTRGDLRARVQQEARAMARLSHPNVVTVHDVGTNDGQIFVAMELVDGETLAEWLRHGPSDWRTVVAQFASIARGLAAAHAAGLVHRDLKPQNILVGSDGRPRITDFGLARLTSSSADPSTDEAKTTALPKSNASGLVGTPAYMAPEQLRGELADARSDQYAFCVCLREALFSSTGAVPQALRDVVSLGLNPDPRARFATMDALVNAMEAAAFTDLAPAVGERARPRRRVMSSIVAVLLVLGLSATSYLRKRPAVTAATLSANDESPAATLQSDAVPMPAASSTSSPKAPLSSNTLTSTAHSSVDASVARRVRPTRTSPSARAEGARARRSAEDVVPTEPPADRGAVMAPSSSASADLLGRRY